MREHLPGFTCPVIDELISAVRQHFPEPDRTDAIILLESLRVAHVQLRRAATKKNPDLETAEVKRLNDRIELLLARKRE